MVESAFFYWVFKLIGENEGGKPFNKLELLARVRSLLRIKFLHDELQEKVIELQKAKEELRHLAITDGLTGLYNYRYFSPGY